MRPLRHFYHMSADLAWAGPVQEHVSALLASGLDCPLTVGMTGPDPQQRYMVQDYWRRVLPDHDIDFSVFTEYGHEDITLRALHSWAQLNPGGAVLYMHAKGSLHTDLVNQVWRRDMTHRLLCGWRESLALLEVYDMTGCHWLLDKSSLNQFWGGNFWWANCKYVASLPEPRVEHDRHDAEQWIGQGDPVVKDLHPGWPSDVLFGMAPGQGE